MSGNYAVTTVRSRHQASGGRSDAIAPLLGAALSAAAGTVFASVALMVGCHGVTLVHVVHVAAWDHRWRRGAPQRPANRLMAYANLVVMSRADWRESPLWRGRNCLAVFHLDHGIRGPARPTRRPRAESRRYGGRFLHERHEPAARMRSLELVQMGAAMRCATKSGMVS